MNANTNINVLGGILDAMLANLVEMIDKRVEAKVFTLTERIERLENDLKAVEGQLFDLKDGTLNLDAVSNRTDEEYLKVTARLEDLEARLAGEQPDATPVVRPTDDVILRLDKMREDTDSLMNCQDHDQMENSRRITELEQRLSARDVQVESLGIDQRDDAKRIDALEGRFSLSILDSEEFRTAVIKIINTHTMGDEFLNPLIDALIDCDTFNDKVKEIAADQVGSSIEDAMSDHCSDYDHDDIHETSDHEVDEDAVKDIIKEVLNNTTVTLKI